MLSLGACTSVYRDHGYVPEDALLEEVVVGVDTRDSVIGTLGKPSASGLVEQSGIYYVGTRFRHWAWRAPEPVQREIVAISFDDQGVVSNIERFGLEDGRVVVISRRVTGEGQGEITLLDQLFSNFGIATPGSTDPGGGPN